MLCYSVTYMSSHAVTERLLQAYELPQPKLQHTILFIYFILASKIEMFIAHPAVSGKVSLVGTKFKRLG